MGCGQGRRRKRRREVGRLAQIRRRKVLLGGRAQTEWNSVWHSTGHLRTWRQRRGKNYSLHYGLRIPEGGEGNLDVSFSAILLYVQNGRIINMNDELLGQVSSVSVCLKSQRRADIAFIRELPITHFIYCVSLWQQREVRDRNQPITELRMLLSTCRVKMKKLFCAKIGLYIKLHISCPIQVPCQCLMDPETRVDGAGGGFVSI